MGGGARLGTPEPSSAAPIEGAVDKTALEAATNTLLARLYELQEAFHADGRHALLLVLQGRRASQVVREFRRFVRNDEGAREPVLLPELFASVVRMVRHEFADADVTLQCRVDPACEELWVERVLVQQVLVNVLHNALEASRGQPVRRVLMRARPTRASTCISIVDSGAGFSAEMRARAFEPFVTARDGGMGMGLAITRRIVESHGGYVAIGKLPGGGAVVSCRFPASSEHQTAGQPGLPAAGVSNDG